MNTMSVRRWSMRVSLIAALSTMAGCAALVTPNFTQQLTELRTGDYELDPEHAYLHFKIEHLGLSTVVGRFNRVRATLDFDPSDIGQMKLDGVVEMSSLDMNNSELEELLQESRWFDVARFPEATFQTTGVTVPSNVTSTANTQNKNAEPTLLKVAGEFTLKGVTREIVLDVKFKGGADNILTGKYTLGFSARGSLKRSDFGVDAWPALVADDVFIELDGEFQATR